MRKTIALADLAIHGLTLPAGEVVEVTIESSRFGRVMIEVYTDGTAPAYITTDGSPPTVAGPNTQLIPPQPSTSTFTMYPGTLGASVLKLISAGTPTVSITRTQAVAR